MELRLTPEQETRLAAMANSAGVDAAQLLLDAASQLIDEHEHFRAAVRMGIEQADRGEFIEGEEMDARVARMPRG